MGMEFSKKDPALVLEERMLHGLFYPLNPDEFASLLKNPRGLLQRIAANRAMEVIIVEIIQHNRLMEELRQLRAELVYDEYIYIDDVSDLEFFLEDEALREELEKIRKDVDEQLQSYSLALGNYHNALQDYSNYIIKIPDEWGIICIRPKLKIS